MLVLTRKLGEGLVLGNEINLKILEIHKNQVKIGIEAPEEILIYRHEVYEQIKAENLKAADSEKENVSKIADKLRRIKAVEGGYR